MTYNPKSRGSIPKSVERFNQNQTGSTIPKGTPVCVNSSGLAMVDVSSEVSVDSFAGVLFEDAVNGQNGKVVSSGTIENITTSFSVGSMVYINKLGLLTNVKPSIGVNGFGEGDFVVKIGMIAGNSTDNTKKDLLVGIQIMGVL